MNIIENKLLDGNKVFKESIFNDSNKLKIVKEQINGQSPFALIVSCSDSRVSPEIIFNTFLGELFVIRTAGNVINEGELASIEYGIKHLNIKYCLVLGHTHCGAIHAAMHKEKGEYLSCILDNISNNIKDEKDERISTIKNCVQQVKYLKTKFPDYDGLIKAGIYDIETNLVTIIE